VVDGQAGVKLFTCETVPGSSGAPIFSMKGRSPRIVSVVSGGGKRQGKDVTFGMDIEAPLEGLKQAMRSGVGVFPMRATTARRVSVNAAPSDESGAKINRIKPNSTAGVSRMRAGGARFVRPQ
jgi:hypothetical protein